MKAKVIFDDSEVEVEFTQEQLEKLGFKFQKITNYPHRPRVDKDELFCFIDYDGIVIYCTESHSDFTEQLYLVGNYFNTEEEAQAKCDEIIAKQKSYDEEMIKKGGQVKCQK